MIAFAEVISECHQLGAGGPPPAAPAPAPVFAVGPVPAEVTALGLARGTLADGAEVVQQVHQRAVEEARPIGRELANQVLLLFSAERLQYSF